VSGVVGDEDALKRLGAPTGAKTTIRKKSNGGTTRVQNGQKGSAPMGNGG